MLNKIQFKRLSKVSFLPLLLLGIVFFFSSFHLPFSYSIGCFKDKQLNGDYILECLSVDSKKLSPYINEHTVKFSTHGYLMNGFRQWVLELDKDDHDWAFVMPDAPRRTLELGGDNAVVNCHLHKYRKEDDTWRYKCDYDVNGVFVFRSQAQHDLYLNAANQVDTLHRFNQLKAIVYPLVTIFGPLLVFFIVALIIYFVGKARRYVMQGL